MDRLLIRLAALLPLFLLLGMAEARCAGLYQDTLNIRFKLDSTDVNLSYDGNAQSWQRFRQDFETRFEGLDPLGIRLDIYAGASPEASAAHNEMLGQRRGESIRWLIRRNYPGRIGEIVIHNEGARWDALYEAILLSNEPWKNEVLAIIRRPSGRDRSAIDPREYQLRALRGGTVWKVLLDKYLPPLRSGASAILSWVGPQASGPDSPSRHTPDTVYVLPASGQAVPGSAGNLPAGTQGSAADAPGTVFIMPGSTAVPSVQTGNPPSRDTLFIVQRDTIVVKDTLVMYYIPDGKAGRPDRPKQKADQTPVWAIKTNLPLLAVMAPNLQVEIPLGRRNRWSLEGEIICPWWTFAHNAYAEQVLNFGLEIRCWLGRREYHPWLDGWHIGLAGAFGYYDLEWKSKGWQGEHVNGYLNIGWQHRWGRNLRWGVDAGIGLGVIWTPRHREYLGSTLFPETHTEEYDDHLMYQNHGDAFFPGPTHANVTLMYFLDWRNKKKEVRR